MGSDTPCTDCDDTGITIQTERTCSCDAGVAMRARDKASLLAGRICGCGTKEQHCRDVKLLEEFRAQALAQGRIEGARIMREAAQAVCGHQQYSPAPYNDIRRAIRTLDPATVIAKALERRALDEALIEGEG